MHNRLEATSGKVVIYLDGIEYLAANGTGPYQGGPADFESNVCTAESARNHVIQMNAGKTPMSLKIEDVKFGDREFPIKPH